MNKAHIDIPMFAGRFKTLIGLFMVIVNYLIVVFIFGAMQEGLFANANGLARALVVLAIFILVLNMIAILALIVKKDFVGPMTFKNMRPFYIITHVIGAVFGLVVSGGSVLLLVMNYISSGSFETFYVLSAIVGAGTAASSLVGLVLKNYLISAMIFLLSLLPVPYYLGWQFNDIYMSAFWVFTGIAFTLFILVIGYDKIKKGLITI